MSSQDSQLVLCVKSALSNKPTYLKIGSKDVSIDSVITKAISTLSENGNAVSAQQLQQLYDSHAMFNNNTQYEKGTMLSSLKSEKRSLQNGEVEIIELDFVAAHSGGK